MKTSVRTVPLAGGSAALVDAEDYDLVMSAGPWHIRPHGGTAYAQRRMPAATKTGWTTQQMHTFLTDWGYVDHRNRNGLDNRRVNLRPAAQWQNNANTKLRSNSTSGFKGVSFKKARGYWIAQIRLHGKTRHLGCFATPEEAAVAYDVAALELFGEFAAINFPKESL